MEKTEQTNYRFYLLDSMQKVMPNSEPVQLSEEGKNFYALRGEVISFQLAYMMEYDGCEIPMQEVELVIASELLECMRILKEELVPSGLPVYRGQLDEQYLYHNACLCPDLLIPLEENMIRPIPYQWRALWFTVDLRKQEKAGNLPIEIILKKDGKVLWKDTLQIHIHGEELSEQRLIHTEWFHADCLANYYQIPVFSELHWKVIGNFMECAVAHGINMLLTPIFTPPLDIKEGGERTTVQLVGVEKAGESYTFDFHLLERWIDLCTEKGIRYIEISHLFTQWGAKYAPKIIASENGVLKRVFGWNTPAVGSEYQAFLKQFLPELKGFLKEKGIFEHTYFHISDEPHIEDKETYAAAKNSVQELLSDCRIIDALSDYELYAEGLVENPIVCNDAIQTYIDAGVENLWTYYCCVQGKGVSNRFLAIPLERIRILGIQLYLYRIQGFLHWGFNFYNSQYSLRPINPYLITDADGGFPSGDPFVVYPAADYTAYSSIRLEIFMEALQDLRALGNLEEKMGRDFVTSLIGEGVDGTITFTDYPIDAGYIRSLRKKIYQELERRDDK